MDVKVKPSLLQGEMRPVSSKMGAHRALIISALANLKTEIEINNNSEEVRATIACLKTLGAYLFTNANFITVRPIDKERVDISEIDFANSFNTLKFMLPIIATFNKTVEITGERALQKKNLEQYLYRLKGIAFRGEKLPFILSGKLLCGEYNIPTELGSQFISGLIIALATLDGVSTVNLIGTSGLTAINNTVELLKKFGVKIQEKESGYVIFGGEIISPEKLTIAEDKDYANYVTAVQKLASKKYDSGEVNVKSNFDMLVCTAITSVFSNSKTEIIFSDKLLEKEGERLTLFTNLLQKLGVKAQLEKTLVITGAPNLKGGVIIDAYKDGSIAMALSILCAFAEEETTILGVENVLKNYPEFFNDLKDCGANIVAL